MPQGLALWRFTASSEILLWKAFFSVDKRAAIGFERVRSKLISMEKDIKEIKNELIK